MYYYQYLNKCIKCMWDVRKRHHSMELQNLIYKIFVIRNIFDSICVNIAHEGVLLCGFSTVFFFLIVRSRFPFHAVIQKFIYKILIITYYIHFVFVQITLYFGTQLCCIFIILFICEWYPTVIKLNLPRNFIRMINIIQRSID